MPGVKLNHRDAMSRAKQGQHLFNMINKILNKFKRKTYLGRLHSYFNKHVLKPDVWHLFLSASSSEFGVQFYAAETLRM